jgi:uncharacterized protein YutE (UPF0331/DUF86 family)
VGLAWVKTRVRSILLTFREIAGALRLQRVKYALQTAVEAIIDSMYHIAAQVCHYAPASAQDAADTLLEKKALDTDVHLRPVNMVGFRKRPVHHYQRIGLANPNRDPARKPNRLPYLG